MSVEIFRSRWELLAPADRIAIFDEIYRTLPGQFPWLKIAKETALNLNAAEAEAFNSWWRHYRKTGEVS